MVKQLKNQRWIWLTPNDYNYHLVLKHNYQREWKKIGKEQKIRLGVRTLEKIVSEAKNNLALKKSAYLEWLAKIRQQQRHEVWDSIVELEWKYRDLQFIPFRKSGKIDPTLTLLDYLEN